MENLASQGGFVVQEAMRLGTGRDIYYYTRDTTHKQSIPTIVDTRFKQALTSMSQGSNTFIISVDQGISDILFWAKLLPHVGGVGNVDYTDLALPRGWLYALINRISIRYAGSSQYFWTGSQCLIENLREMPNPTTRDQLFQLGGAAMIGGSSGTPADNAGDFSGDNLYAYAYLNFPHDSPNGSMMKPNPFPSELLSQPLVITLELNYLPSIFSSNVALGSLAGAPKQLEKGEFQVKQVHAMDRADLMVSLADRSKAYSFPTKAFYQNEITVSLPSNGQSQQNVLLTGFRAGQVRSIILWLTDDADTNPDTAVPFVKNYTNFAMLHDVQLLYNGTVYYDAPATSSQFWNLVSTETPSQLNATVLSLPGSGPGNPIVRTEKASNWVEIPFSQVFEQLSGAHMYVAGKSIMNAVVNLTLSVPDPSKAYTLHAVYAYNCVMMCQAGSVDYVF
jgi:hypothetical protein